MNELKEWPASLLMATAQLLCFFVAAPIGIGCLAGAGWGWLTFALLCLIGAKASNDVYREGRGLDK